jgi:hypothetical protein
MSEAELRPIRGDYSVGAGYGSGAAAPPGRPGAGRGEEESRRLRDGAGNEEASHARSSEVDLCLAYIDDAGNIICLFFLHYIFADCVLISFSEQSIGDTASSLAPPISSL